MSRIVQTMAPVLKLLLVVLIIAAWVEANAKRITPEHPPEVSAETRPPADAPMKGSADCSLRIDKRNVKRIVPARPPVIET